MMATVQETVFSFDYSVKMLRVVQAEFEIDVVVQAGMNDVTNLQSHCDITWDSHANALLTFKAAFTVVIYSKAKCYFLSMTNVDFVIALVTIDHIPTGQTM